jgi:hypothetical protein
VTSSCESRFERLVSAALLAAFWLAFTTLAAGLMLWLAAPATDAGAACLTAGLLGLLVLPLLRLTAAMATSLRERDWLTLLAALAVLAILTALTLRDAVGQ